MSAAALLACLETYFVVSGFATTGIFNQALAYDKHDAGIVNSSCKDPGKNHEESVMHPIVDMPNKIGGGRDSYSVRKINEPSCFRTLMSSVDNKF